MTNLVLSRKNRESILILSPDNLNPVVITVSQIYPNAVKLCCQADNSILINRSELGDKTRHELISSGQSSAAIQQLIDKLYDLGANEVALNLSVPARSQQKKGSRLC